MAGVRSLLVLARDRAALGDGFAALVALGFSEGWAPTALGGGVTSAAVRAGRVTLELLDAPPSQVAWHSWGHRSQRLALLAAGVGGGAGAAAHHAGDAPRLLQRLADSGRPAGGVRAWLPSQWAGSTARDGAAVLAVEPASSGAWDADALPPAAPPPASLVSLKEVVIGSSTDGLTASLAALALHGATSCAPAHSVFSFGRAAGAGEGRAADAAATAVRLLPSRYSCLVLRSPAPLAVVQRVLASHAPDSSASVLLRVGAAMAADAAATRGGLSPPPPAPDDDGFYFGPPRRAAGPSELALAAPPMGWQAAIYGARSGDARSAQLLLRGGPLAGLDVRFCAQPDGWHAPYFNECPESLSDDVDPSLNPPPGDARAAAALSCQSVSGLEVLSTLRARLGFRREGGGEAL